MYRFVPTEPKSSTKSPTKPKSTKRPGNHGLYAGTHPVSIRAYIDQDYLNQLSEEEKAWLSEFNDNYYSGDFRGPQGDRYSLTERRKIYVQKNAANHDCYAAIRHFNLSSDIDDHREEIPNLPGQDFRKEPEYLNSTAYRAALAKYREQLTPTRKHLLPKITPDYTKALSRLKEVVRQGQGSEPDYVVIKEKKNNV